jgi:hypothetical protein
MLKCAIVNRKSALNGLRSRGACLPFWESQERESPLARLIFKNFYEFGRLEFHLILSKAFPRAITPPLRRFTVCKGAALAPFSRACCGHQLSILQHFGIGLELFSSLSVQKLHRALVILEVNHVVPKMGPLPQRLLAAALALLSFVILNAQGPQIS